MKKSTADVNDKTVDTVHTHTHTGNIMTTIKKKN